MTDLTAIPEGAKPAKPTPEIVEIPFSDPFYVTDTGIVLLVDDCEGEEYVILPSGVRKHLPAILEKMERMRRRAYERGLADGKADKAREIKQALGL